MAKIISVEGPIGVGKTTLVNHLSTQLNVEKRLEHSQKNPYIDKFYSGENVKLETELTFLLLHYSLLKSLISNKGVILTDFSIEKDLVFARMNLTQAEFGVFKHVYDHVVESVGLPDLVIFLDLPFEILIERIKHRGRPYEVNADPTYFRDYSNRLKSYFSQNTNRSIIFLDVKDLQMTSNITKNEKLNQIKLAIKQS
jgi:deoxyadenosine/deoxycytidine kinase